MRRGCIARRIRFSVALLAAFVLFVACSSDTTKNFQQLEPESNSITLSQTDSQESKMSSTVEDDILQMEISELDEVYAKPEYRTIVLDFFIEQTGSTEIADLILRETERHELPVSLTFALAWVESRFNPLAVNYNQSSIDRGVFQLNNRSFPKLREDQFFNPEVNIVQGVAYLKYCLERGENQVTALAMYNAGPRRVSERGAPLMTLKYINRILNHREKIQQEFKVSMKAASRDVKLVKSEKNRVHVVDRTK